MLDREIQDLQSEFETERVDYLETIRRQDRQLKLLNQILMKIQPLVRKDSNYGYLKYSYQFDLTDNGKYLLDAEI